MVQKRLYTVVSRKEDMKIDCNKTEEFFKEWERFCHTQMACNLCELNSSCVSWSSKAKMFSRSSEFAEGIQKWSDRHPQKTYLEDFLEKFPAAPINSKTSRPKAYPCDIYKGIGCNYENCEPFDCWYVLMEN